MKNKFINLIKHYKIEIKKSIDDLKTKGKRKKQIPNILTSSRIVAPLFIVPFAITGNFLVAGIITSCFAMTDFFDGLLARKLNAQSEFGRELDPVADKIFGMGLVIPLIVTNPALILTLLLETGIATVNLISKAKNNIPKTNIIGKIKTWALSILIITSYINLFMPINQVLNIAILTSTSILQTLAIYKYKKDDLKKDKIQIDNSECIMDVPNDIENEKVKSIKKLIVLLKEQKNILENQNKETLEYEKTLHK